MTFFFSFLMGDFSFSCPQGPPSEGYAIVLTLHGSKACKNTHMKEWKYSGPLGISMQAAERDE